MNILRLNRFFQLESADTNAIETIRLDFADILNSFDFRTRSEPEGIHFYFNQYYAGNRKYSDFDFEKLGNHQRNTNEIRPYS